MINSAFDAMRGRVEGGEADVHQVAADDGDMWVRAGRMTAGSLVEFRLTLLDVVDRARGTVVVDLSGAELLDARGGAILVGASRRLAQRGGRLVLAGAAGPVRAALAAEGLGRHLSVLAAS